MSTRDRIRQVKTTKERHGKDHYRNIGRVGGINSTTKFTSDTGRLNAIKRWGDKRKEENGE